MEKKTVRKSFLILLILCGFISCKNHFMIIDEKESNNENEIQEIVIGDEIIYGEEFSFQEVYDEAFEELEEASRQISARTAYEVTEISELSDEDFEQYVYFSVLPTSMNAIEKIKEHLGYLNPVEMDKEIIQACNPEKIILKEDVEITEETNPEEVINLDTKYYYILKKVEVEEKLQELEGYEVIEEFEMLTEAALERLKTEYAENLSLFEENCSRGIWSKIGKALKKAVEKVVDFVVKEYEIKGSAEYTVNGITVPAYGIRISNECILGKSSQTNKEGKFSVGSRSDAAGLCFLWVEFENEACKLSNILGIYASVLVKTSWPSKLTNVKIKADSDSENAKMAICDDLLRRYEDEKTRHGNIPKAKIWITKKGDGTSSAPCFNYLGANLLPDILLTGISAQSMRTLETLHHEYTHYLHCVYAENNNLFWNDVVLSEIGCTVASATIESIDFETPFVAGTYNFNNPHVCFAENLAEWYSYVGCYGQGAVGKVKKISYGYGTTTYLGGYYDNIFLFSELISNFDTNYSNNQKQQLSFTLINLIDEYNITTFADFYDVLIKEYPSKKTVIQSVFKTYYNQHGTREGNVIKY